LRQNTISTHEDEVGCEHELCKGHKGVILLGSRRKRHGFSGNERRISIGQLSGLERTPNKENSKHRWQSTHATACQKIDKISAQKFMYGFRPT
jgi:hypothetical protein